MSTGVLSALISQPLFGSTLELPTTGLGKAFDLPYGNTDICKASFSLLGNPISIPIEKHALKQEFFPTYFCQSFPRQVGAYDKITQERFMYITLITSKIGVNWSDILFTTLCEMTKGKTNRKGSLFKSFIFWVF